MGEEREKREAEAVKDYFLNITSGHHAKAVGSDFFINITNTGWNMILISIQLVFQKQIAANNHTSNSQKAPEIIYNVTKVIFK